MYVEKWQQNENNVISLRGNNKVCPKKKNHHLSINYNVRGLYKWYVNTEAEEDRLVLTVHVAFVDVLLKKIIDEYAFPIIGVVKGTETAIWHQKYWLETCLLFIHTVHS